MITIHCTFCRQEATYVPIPVQNEIGSFLLSIPSNNTRMLKVHYCATCLAEYVLWTDDGKVASVHLYTTINNKMYRWSITALRKEAQLWYVGQPGIPGKQPNKDMQLLKCFEEYADLSPTNVNEKIRTYLLFL